MTIDDLLLAISQQLNEAIADPANLMNADDRHDKALKVEKEAKRALDAAEEMYEREEAKRRLEVRKLFPRDEVNDRVTLMKEIEGHPLRMIYDTVRRARELFDAAHLHCQSCRKKAYKESKNY